jgi:hypothetical protein
MTTSLVDLGMVPLRVVPMLEGESPKWPKWALVARLTGDGNTLIGSALF